MKHQLSISTRYWTFLPVCSFLMYSLLASGCDPDVTATEDDNIEPGSFSITQISSTAAAKQAASSTTEGQSAASFDLGNIDNTTDFYFVLTNAGDTDIEDISIEVDHPAFEISPSGMEVLRPFEEMALHQVVKLTVVHGTSPSRLGHAPLLNPGSGSSVLNISGTTTDAAGESLEAALTADISLHARLADIRVFSTNGEIDLGSPDGATINGSFLNEFIKQYNTVNGEHVIENTGNVNVEVTVFESIGFDEITSVELAPEEQFEVFHEHGIIIRMDPGSVITDHERMLPLNDGRVYIWLMSPHPDPSFNQADWRP